jgi:hypothetical protein
MKRYKTYNFNEGKNVGSFLGGSETANKTVNQIKKILTLNKMFLQTRLGYTGWTVYWNGFEILIDFSPLWKKDKRGINTDILEKDQKEEFDKGFSLIKNRYSTAILNKRSIFQIIIPSEE